MVLILSRERLGSCDSCDNKVFLPSDTVCSMLSVSSGHVVSWIIFGVGGGLWKALVVPVLIGRSAFS